MEFLFNSLVSKVKGFTHQIASENNDAETTSLSMFAFPKNLDVTCLTPNLMISLQPLPALNPTYNDTGRDEPYGQRSPQHNTEGTPAPAPNQTLRPLGNCPVALAQFVSKRQQQNNQKILFLNLSDEDGDDFATAVPDDRIKTLLQRQVVTLKECRPTGSPTTRLPIPTLGTLLQVCYILSAWLEPINDRNTPLAPQGAAILYCSRKGKPRCAIAAAAWLRYSRQVETCREGFEMVMSRLCASQTPTEATKKSVEYSYWDAVPASLRRLLQNFDTLLERSGQYPNVRPMLLRAVAIQGLPVDQRPVIEVWDSQQCLYSSLSDDKAQWVEEEGFYQTGDVLIEGEWSVVCNFATHDNDTSESSSPSSSSLNSSKLILRFAANTGFLQAGTLELDANQVDLMRQYAGSLDDEFLLSLVLESHWNVQHEINPVLLERLRQESSVLPTCCHTAQARETGWQLLSRHHAAQPLPQDVQHFRMMTGLRGIDPPDHIVALALQLANFDAKMAESLLHGRFHSWWRRPESPTSSLSPISEILPSVQCPSFLSPPMTAESKRQTVLDVLDESNVMSMLSKDDLERGSLLQDKEFEFDSHPIKDDDILDYVSPLLTPNPGDIYNTLRQTRDPFATFPVHTSASSQLEVRPIFPLHRTTPWIDPKRNRLDNPQYAAAAEMLMKIEHAGVTLDDLIELSQLSQTWTTQNDPYSMNAENATKIEQNDKSSSPNELALEADPVYEKYFRMRSKGLPDEAVRHALQRDGLDPHILDMDPKKSLVSQQSLVDDTIHSSAAALPNKESLVGYHEISSSNGSLEQHADVPIKSDPKYEKYFRMLAKGLPDGAVRNALQRDGVEPSLLDMNPDKSFASQSTSSMSTPQHLPLQEDPKYEKYFRMLQKGLPDGAVRNALQRDGLDPGILDLDPKKSLNEQQVDVGHENKDQPITKGIQSEKNHSGMPEKRASADHAAMDGEGVESSLKQDPKYEKYFRMLDKGLPKGAIRNALLRDGLDPAIIDMDPERSLISQTAKVVGEINHLKNDPKFEKYVRMLEKGLPEGAVRNAMQRDGLDPCLLDVDSNMPSMPDSNDEGLPLKNDPIYEKYFRMLSKGLSDGAVRNAIQRDGLDPAVLGLNPDKTLLSQTKNKSTPDSGPPLKDDPVYNKYFRMLAKDLPVGAVRNALQRDGLDPSVLDLDPNKSFASQSHVGVVAPDSGIPLRDDPDWKKYFTMLQMGLPLGAVKNAVTRDGKDPAVLDLDPNKSIEVQLSSNRVKAVSASLLNKKKKRVRRKKIYWTPIEPAQIKEDSLWSLVRGKVQMSRLKYDVQEFEDLFTESADPNDQKRKKSQGSAKKVKKSVQVIDGKRSMNGGIILLRLRMDYKLIAQMVDNMDAGKLDATQLQALKEFLPTSEERKGLLDYMASCGEADEQKRVAYVQLSECEKYMYTMIDVEAAAEKFDCMIYRVQFKPRISELLDAIRVVEKACDEVRNSEKLREILAMILSLVNEINTGGDGNEAIGFSLDALLKLNEAKAFDRKTSVLQYLVRLILCNDSALLDFRKDLVHLSAAETVILDSLIADIESLEGELTQVRETAKLQADRFAEDGKIQPFSIQELKEQKTAVRSIENVPQYNQIQHLTGRTSMERFTINASRGLEDAIALAHQVKDSYSKLLEYMCEKENMASNDFFGTMRRFADEFDKARDQVDKEEKLKKRDQARSAAKRSPTSKVQGDGRAVTQMRISSQTGINATHGANAAAAEATASSQGNANPLRNTAMQAHAVASTKIVASANDALEKSTTDTRQKFAAFSISRESASTAQEGEGDPDGGSINASSSLPTKAVLSPAGLASMAAAAAAKRMGNSPETTEPADRPSPPLSQSPVSLASMAAAAAAKRMGNTSESPEPTDRPSPPLSQSPVSLAAMAAAAAAKRMGNSSESPEPTDRPSPPLSPSPVSLAAMAAAAAAKRMANRPDATTPADLN